MSQEPNPLTDSTGGTLGVPSTLGQVLETPQAAPTVGQPPDTSTLPPSPQQGGDNTDWQSMFQEERDRRQGLDRSLQQEKAVRQQLAMQLNQLQQQAPVEPQAPAPTPEPPQAQVQTDVLGQAIQQRQAEQYRDLLITQFEAELGVPLSMFRDRIPAIPPVLGADGAIDDTAQRTEIQNMAQALQQVQGTAQQQTQDALLTGQTPGSAPGAPTTTTAADTYQEFLDILEIQGSTEFQDLGKAEQQRIEARYFELLDDPDIEAQHGGMTRPTMDWQEMQKTIRDLVQKVNANTITNMRPGNTV